MTLFLFFHFCEPTWISTPFPEPHGRGTNAKPSWATLSLARVGHMAEGHQKRASPWLTVLNGIYCTGSFCCGRQWLLCVNLGWTHRTPHCHWRQACCSVCFPYTQDPATTIHFSSEPFSQVRDQRAWLLQLNRPVSTPYFFQNKSS